MRFLNDQPFNLDKMMRLFVFEKALFAFSSFSTFWPSYGCSVLCNSLAFLQFSVFSWLNNRFSGVGVLENFHTLNLYRSFFALTLNVTLHIFVIIVTSYIKKLFPVGFTYFCVTIVMSYTGKSFSVGSMYFVTIITSSAEELFTIGFTCNFMALYNQILQ